jgi:hypothetical protein
MAIKKSIFDKSNTPPAPVVSPEKENNQSPEGNIGGVGMLAKNLPSENIKHRGRPSQASRDESEKAKATLERKRAVIQKVLAPEAWIPPIKLLPNVAFLATKDDAFLMDDREALQHATLLTAVIEAYSDDIEDPRILILGAFCIDYSVALGSRMMMHIQNKRKKKQENAS